MRLDPNYESETHRWFYCRGFSMSGNTIRAESRHRLLRDPTVHSEHSGRHPVVGVVLDQRRGFAGTRLTRSPHRAHDDHHECRSTLVSASCLLHQGCRRLDDPVSVVRLRVADRVRRRQCAGTSTFADRCAARVMSITTHHSHRTVSDELPPHWCCSRPSSIAGYSYHRRRRRGRGGGGAKFGKNIFRANIIKKIGNFVIFLLLVRYVPNVAKRSIWDQCKKKYVLRTDRRTATDLTLG